MSQSLTKIYIHIIFSTKDRYPFFQKDEINAELYKYVAGILQEKESFPILINGASDHVHILCDLPKTISLSDLIANIKRSSSIWLKTKSDMFNKFYWQRGYGAFSVSESHLEIVKEYIANQKNHHRVKTFKDEFVGFLKHYHITFDEQYLWD